MSKASLSEWLDYPPETMVIGDGPYAKALAFVLGTVPITHETLLAEPTECLGGYPRVFEDLKRCFLVVPESMAAAEALRCHEFVWHWVELLSSVHEMHELLFIFVIPHQSSSSYEESLAFGLATTLRETDRPGFSTWNSSGPLAELIDLATKTTPIDLQTHRARLRGDTRRIALLNLHAALLMGDELNIEKTFKDVNVLFQGQEVHLDLFCCPPSHRNGNLFRTWLASGVTEGVTPDWCETGKHGLQEWLRDDLLKDPI